MLLKRMFETQLPLNRKERFYTGTVFPMIVGKDNFKHFHLLLSELGIANPPQIFAKGSKTNIQFFTEYSLVESQKGTAEHRFRGLPKTKDTPDIVILVMGKTKILIALEGKMYDVPDAKALNRQMDAQGAILECIKKDLHVDKVYHYALLPKELKKQMPSLDYKIVTWEAIYKAYRNVCRGDYFLELLRIALEEYDELVSPGIAFGRNCEKKMSGSEILRLFRKEEGNLKLVSMGRDGGINGRRLENDIESGNWRDFRYETSSKKPTNINPNWFLIEDFVKIIKNK